VQSAVSSTIRALERELGVEPTGGLRGTLTIGTMQSLKAVDLPRPLDAFSREHPHVELRVLHTRGGSVELADETFIGRDPPLRADVRGLDRDADRPPSERRGTGVSRRHRAVAGPVPLRSRFPRPVGHGRSFVPDPGTR
jgi:hypothetical protein